MKPAHISLTAEGAEPRRRRAWLGLAGAFSSAVLLLAGTTTSALAEGTPGGPGDPGSNASQVTGAQQSQGEQESDFDDARHDNRPRVINVSALVTALNSQLPALTTVSVGDGGAVVPVEDVQTVSLAGITSRLNPTDAQTVASVVNANTSSVQAFLNGGTPGANAIVAALNASGINPGNVLGILPSGDDTLLILLA